MPTSSTSQQCAKMLLSSIRLNRPDVNPTEWFYRSVIMLHVQKQKAWKVQSNMVPEWQMRPTAAAAPSSWTTLTFASLSRSTSERPRCCCRRSDGTCAGPPSPGCAPSHCSPRCRIPDGLCHSLMHACTLIQWKEVTVTPSEF